MTRRVLAVLTALLALGACSSGGSDKPSSSPTSTTAGTADTAAYVDAVYDGLVSETPAVPKDDMRCVAEAIVGGIGVQRFHDAGLTVAQVRDPDFEPPESIAQSMKTDERVAFATQLQSCGIGRIVAASIVGSFGALTGPTGTRAEQCFVRGFAGAPARRMIAGLMLNDVSIPDATRLATITVSCLGLGPLVENAAGVELSAVESQCVDRAGRTDTAFMRLLADEFRNAPPTAKTAQQRLGVQVFACLTPAHRAALSKS